MYTAIQKSTFHYGENGQLLHGPDEQRIIGRHGQTAATLHKIHRELALAFEKSRKKHTITPQDLDLTDPSSALDLCCVNYLARLRWSRGFCKEFAMFFGLHDQNPYPDQPLFFVTLTDVFCTTDHDAPWIDIYDFRRKLQAGLRGLSSNRLISQIFR
jgi:hypothetical protein